MWHVYILQCADSTFYTGVTKDLKRRLLEHNSSPLGARYTRSRRPVKLLYSAKKKDRASAQAEEIRIKRLPRIKKLELIKNKNNPCGQQGAKNFAPCLLSRLGEGE